MIKWAMIGAGDVTEVKSGPAFNKVNDSKLIAVMRRDAAKAADYARRHHVPVWYSDVDRLLADEEINAVYIATPPYVHLDYAKRALERGKMVYVEKPMVMNYQEGLELVNLIEKHQAKLVVAHYRRMMPYFIKIAELIRSEVIGQPKMIHLMTSKRAQSTLVGSENWRVDPAISGGGLFHDLAPHQIDLMLHLFGKPLAYTGLSDVSAENKLACKVSGQILFREEVLFSGNWFFDAEDEQDSCVVYGSAGSIRFSFFNNAPIVVHSQRGTETYEFPLPEHVQQPLIEETVRYFQGVRKQNPSDARDGLIGISIMDSFARTPYG